jgi:hypothetical protein
LKRFISWLAFALALPITASLAQAQVSVYTTVIITPSTVYGWGVTNIEDGFDQLYYSPVADVYLYQDSTNIDHDLANPTSGSWVEGDVAATVAAGHSYWIWTNHWMAAYYDDPPDGYCDEDGYSLLTPGDSDPGTVLFAPGTVSYTSSPTIYVGSTTDATNSYAPTISGVDQTTYGTAQADTSGYVVVYGNYLSTMAGATTIAIDGVTVSVSWDDWTYPTQLNGYYSIPFGTSPGTHTLTITTPFGYATHSFTVYSPPAPVITGITPNNSSGVLVGGASMEITVTGQYFGPSCPSTVNLPSGVTQTLGPGDCSDTYFNMSVQGGFGAAIGYDSLTVTTIGGTSNASTFLVNGPASMVVVTDTANTDGSGNLISRDTNYAVENYDFSVANGPEDTGLTLGEAGSFTWNPGATCLTPAGAAAPWGFNACGTGHTAAGGTFTDSWYTFNGDHPSTCRGTINYDHWQWCGGVEGPSTGITFATLSGSVGVSSVTNDGVVMPSGSLAAGTRFVP